MTIRIPRSVLVLALVLVVGAAAFAMAGRSHADPTSTSLHGSFTEIANFFAPACPSVTGVCSSFTASGIINGTGVVQVDTAPDANGFSKAHTVITTAKGKLTCHEAAIFDLADSDHPFVDLCLIDGGTGLYQDASGWIQEVGTFNFAANVGQLNYYGQINYAS